MFLIPSIIVAWDEGTYLLQILLFSQSITNGLWQNVSSRIFADSVYPPLHPLLLSLFTHKLPFSITLVRGVNLLFLIGSVIGIFFAASLFFGKKGGSIAKFSLVGLFISSPMIAYYSAIVMKELPGAFFTILTVYFYGVARKKHTLFSVLCMIFSLLLLFLTKYNYGIVCLFGIMIEYLLLFITPGTKKLRLFMTGAIIFFFSCMSIWIYKLGGITLFQNYISLYKSFAPTAGALHDSGASFMFYPKSILYLYAPTVPLGVILLVGFFLSILYLQNPLIRISLITSLIGMLVPTILYAQNLQDRFILPVFPLFLLSSILSLFFSIQKITQKFSFTRFIYYFLYGISTVYALWILSTNHERIIKVSAYAGKSPTFNQTDYHDTAMWFNYNPSQWPKKINISSEKPRDVYSFIFSSIDPSKPIQFVGRSNEFSEPYTTLLLELEKKKSHVINDSYSSYVATIEILPESKFYTKDFQIMNAWTMEHVHSIRSDPTLTKIAEKTFEDIGVVAQVFGK